MAEFKIGDTVRLKSGGPIMTVSEPRTQYGAVSCHWFNHNGGEYTEKWGDFKPEMLKRVELAS